MSYSRFLYTIVGILFFLCVNSTLGFSQKKVEISLKKNITLKYTNSTQFQLGDKKRLIGIPQDVDTFLVWRCPMSYSLRNYDHLKTGKISQERFNSLEIDPLSITDKSIDFYIEGISAFKKGQKVIIIDSNNNQDLSDEPVFVFDTVFSSLDERLMSYKNFPTLLFYYDHFFNGKVYSKSVAGRIQPFIKFVEPTEKTYEDLAISLKIFEQYSGTFSLDGKRKNIIMENFSAHEFKHAWFYLSDSGETSNKKVSFRFNQPIYSGFSQIKVDSFLTDKNKLLISIEKIEKSDEIKGGREGMIAPSIKFEDIGGELFSSEAFKGKYMILNFWGTWCGPCKADHPNLIELYKETDKTNAILVNIALDRSKENVLEYLMKSDLEGIHIYKNMTTEMNEENSLANKYYISSFPTYILIAPTKKIVSRGSLNRIREEMEKLRLVK